MNGKLWLLIDSVHKKLLRARLWTTSLDDYKQDIEDAIKALTLNTAKILGIDDEIGSLEKGKEATFFISSGDALDIIQNNVENIFIKGEVINLENHQSILYKKYKEK